MFCALRPSRRSTNHNFKWFKLFYLKLFGGKVEFPSYYDWSRVLNIQKHSKLLPQSFPVSCITAHNLNPTTLSSKMPRATHYLAI